MKQEFSHKIDILKPIFKVLLPVILILGLGACGPEGNPTSPSQPTKQKICVVSKSGDTITKIVGENNLDPYSTEVTVDQSSDGSIDYKGVAYQGPSLQNNTLADGTKIVDTVCFQK